jgi:hypothetical protein
MKLSLILVTLISLLASSSALAHPISANTESVRAVSTEKTMVKTERKAVVSEARKTNANREIDRRVKAMTALMARINNLKKLTNDQKTSLVAQLQKAIDDLTALKAKIAADTDEATLKADKQSIIDLYRVFTVLMPKAEIMAHANSLLQTIADANTTTANFQTRWQASGKDLSSLQPFLTARQAKLAEATTQAQNAIATVSSLQPADSPTNKTSLENARGMLKQSRENLRLAHQELVKANRAFKALK